MYKLGRMLLWLFPPLGLWRSIAAGRRKRDARLVAALGGDPTIVNPRRWTLGGWLVGLAKKKAST